MTPICLKGSTLREESLKGFYRTVHDFLARNIRLTLAIDGPCASGKTTLATSLVQKYDANLFHLDDFFLRPCQRTPERLTIPGENIDHERFLKEVLQPLSLRQAVTLYRYNCRDDTLEPPEIVPCKPMNVIEGVYACHPKLIPYYDLILLMTVDPQIQRERILGRNTPEIAAKYFSVWIPMEERYFQSLNTRFPSHFD